MFPAALLLAALAARPAAIPPGEAVVRAAYDMYHGRWFANAFYIARMEISDEPQRVETWYESVVSPGLMRIDVAPAMTGRAIFFRNDSTYEIGKGQIQSAVVGVQPLFVLLHDLHSAPPAHTIAMLNRYRFDLTRTHTRVWDGEPVIVVGALAGDTTSNQFWLEKKRMILVRMIEQNGADVRRPLDARITGYKKAGNGWLETNVRMFLGGVLSTAAEYTIVRVNTVVEPGLFEPTPFRRPIWVRDEKDIFGGVPASIPQGAHP